MEGLMILGKGDMPQYVTHKGQQLDRKVNETYGMSSDPGKEGMPQYVTVNRLRYTMSQNYYALK